MSCETWHIVDKRTSKRIGVGGYFNQQQAERQIEEWWARHRRGGRPDITADLLSNMLPEKVSS